MKRFLQTFALLTALLMSWVSQAQATLTVANGTETNEYVPVYGYYVDAYVRCQMIYPSTNLVAMTGGVINSMTFYSSDANISWGSAAFQVKVSEVAATSLTDWLSSSATTVYSGALSINASGQMVVNFTTPYVYGGGNLLVEIISTATGSYVSAEFYGITSSGASVQGYDYDGSDYYAEEMDFLPKTMFGYTPGNTTCPMPFNLTVSNITTSSADITWSDTSGAGAWRVWWVPADTLSRLDSTDVYDTTYSLTGLGEYASYIVRVATICSGEESFPMATTFQTATSSISYSMTQTLDTLVTCGALIYDNGGPTASYSNNANNTLIVRSASNDSVLVISGTLNCESNYDYLYIYDGIGTSGQQLFYGSGSANIGPFTSQSGAFTIVFTSDVSMSYAGYELFARCIYIPCPEPYNIALDSIGTDWASISWQQNGNAYGWVVEYDTMPFTPGTSTAMGQEIVYDSSIFIQYLDSAHTYYMSIHADCGGDTSGNVLFQFNTLVAAPATVPYFCGFEGNGPNGWEFIQDGQPNYWMVGNATSNGGNRSLYITNNGTSNSYNNGSSSYVYATRAFNLSDTGEYSYAFDWKAEGESTWDYLRAWLVPSSVSLTAGQLPDGSTSTNSYSSTSPSGWISLDGGSILNLQSGWQSRNSTLHLNQPGSYTMVFMWVNDGSQGSTPPAAIDNVQLVRNTCPAPTNIHVSHVSADTIILGWTPGGFESEWEVTYDSTTIVVYDTTYIFDGLNANTEYSFMVRAICSAGDTSMAATFSARTDCGAITVLPYMESFEGLPAGSSSNLTCGVPCWGRLDNASQYHFGYIGSPSSWPSGGHTGTGFLYYYMPTTTGTYADWIITILPDIDVTVYPLNTLQVSFWVKMNDATISGDIQVGVISDATDATTFVPVDTVHVSGNNYDLKTAYLSNYFGTGSHIALKFFRNSSAVTYYFVDDVTVELIPDCPPVTNITLSGLDSNELSLTWTENGTATSWDIEYDVTGFTLGTGNTVTATSNVGYTITGLSPNTEYDIYITPICSGGTSATRMGTFRTANSYIRLPFSCDFEDSVQNNVWILENGTLTNKWHIGTATYNGIGNHGLYISNNNGTSCAYTVSSSTMVYAYADVMIDTLGDYSYSFDWKLYGEGSFDYLRVALAPSSVTLTASSSILSGLTTTSLPTGWIALDGGSKLNLQTNWQTRTDIITLNTPGVYHLVFAFRCDNSGGSTPPAAIDNVVLARLTCPRPQNITLSNMTQNGTDVSWQEMGTASEWEYQLGSDTPVVVYDTNCTLTSLTANTSYTFRVRSICGIGDTSLWTTYTFRTPCGYVSIPYTQTFESATTGSSTTATFVDCMTRLNNGTTYFGWPYVGGSTYNHTTSGSKGLYWYDNTTTGTYGDYQCIVLPPVDPAVGVDSLQFSFWVKTSSASYTPVFKIGVMTDPNNIATFVGIDTVTITTGTTWTHIEVPLTSYTGTGLYVALKADRPGSSWYAYVDDLSLEIAPTCPSIGGLALMGSTSTSATLNWTERGYAMEWEVAMENSATATPAGDSVFYTRPATFNGLTPGNSYYFWVRPICGVGDTGAWEGPLMVTPGSWNMRPNMTDTLRMCGGIIYDEGGAANDYSTANQDSYIILMPDQPNSLVSLSGTTYTEGSYDYIRIYDGIGTNGTELYTDYNITTSQTFGPITSTSGPVTIYFHTDGSVFHDGFAINISCITTTCRVFNIHLDPMSAASSSQLAVVWDTNGALSYEVEYGPQGFTQGTGTIITTMTNSAILPGLLPVTAYDVYVRSICGMGDTGSWSRATFQTAMCENASTAESYGAAMSATTSDYSIVYPYYEYSYSQTIINAAQLASLNGDITAIEVYTTSTNGSLAWSNCDVYLANVTDSVLSAGYIMPSSTNPFTKVITNGNLSYTDAGWNAYMLDTAFAWDGHSNLLLAVNRKAGTWVSSSDYPAHSTSAVTFRIAFQDDDSVSMANPSLAEYDEYEMIVPDIRFVSCAVSCAMPRVVSTTVTPTTADIAWVGTSNHYEVAIKPLADANWPAPTPVTGSSYSFTLLQPSTNYAYHIRQDCSADSLGYSSWYVGYFVTDSLGCVAPAAPVRTAMTNNSATFSWTPAGNETAWQMRVFNSAFDSVYAPVTTPSATVGGLMAGVNYYAAVRSLCGATQNVEGPWSDSVQFSTQVCPNVTGVSSSDVTFNSVTLRWDAVSSAQRYEVEYGMSGFTQGNGMSMTSHTNSLTIVGLMDETSYQFYVRAICGTGWMSENWSTPVEVTTGAIVGTTYVVTLTANNSQWGRVTGGGLYAENSTVEIEAIPYEGYTFEGWSDQVTTNPRTLTVTSDIELTANFDPMEDDGAVLVVNYNGELGYVEINGRETNIYNGHLGDEVRLRAYCYEGCSFVNWSDGDTSIERTVTLSQSRTELTANFSGNNGISTVSDGIGCLIYPNPTSSSTTISVSGANGKVRISVVDINGRVVVTETLECAGDCVKTMSVENLSQGAYFVRITGEQVNLVKKLVVK